MLSIPNPCNDFSLLLVKSFLFSIIGVLSQLFWILIISNGLFVYISTETILLMLFSAASTALSSALLSIVDKSVLSISIKFAVFTLNVILIFLFAHRVLYLLIIISSVLFPLKTTLLYWLIVPYNFDIYVLISSLSVKLPICSKWFFISWVKILKFLLFCSNISKYCLSISSFCFIAFNSYNSVALRIECS